MTTNIVALGEAQKLFFEITVQWMVWALGRGYRFTYGEAKRSDEQAEINAIGEAGREKAALLLELGFPGLAHAIRNNGKANGIRNTAHGKQLALDLNAFKNDRYLTTTEEWTELGMKWESLHPLARWGGRFKDGNHLSFEWEGVK